VFAGRVVVVKNRGAEIKFRVSHRGLSMSERNLPLGAWYVNRIVPQKKAATSAAPSSGRKTPNGVTGDIWISPELATTRLLLSRA
jgi:hypothetical protein